MAEQADDWGKHLDAAVFTTNFTPFRMMFGCEPRFPLEAEKQLKSTTSEDVGLVLQTADVETTLDKKQARIFKTADERIKLAQQKQKEQYKKRKGIVEYNFKIGNKVQRRSMLQKTRKGNKEKTDALPTNYHHYNRY